MKKRWMKNHENLISSFLYLTQVWANNFSKISLESWKCDKEEVIRGKIKQESFFKQERSIPIPDSTDSKTRSFFVSNPALLVFVLTKKSHKVKSTFEKNCPCD